MTNLKAIGLSERIHVLTHLVLNWSILSKNPTSRPCIPLSPPDSAPFSSQKVIVLVHHNSKLLLENCVGFLPMSVDNTKGIKNVTLRGRAYGFPFDTLRGGYLLCFKDKFGNEQREQMDSLAAIRHLLEEQGDPKDFVVFSYFDLCSVTSTPPEPYVDPSHFDVLLTDMQESNLFNEIAYELGVVYLEQQTRVGDGKNPVVGCLYGIYFRPMVNLVIESKRFKKPINVIFIVDTGAPGLFISEKALNALGITELPTDPKQAIKVEFGGLTHEAIMSPTDSHYADFNLLGGAFLARLRAFVTVDYCGLTVNLEFK